MIPPNELPPNASPPLIFTEPCPISLPAQPRASVPAPTAGRIRILVAEDDPVSLELICAQLLKWGYDVLPTQNGTDAIMALRKPDAPSIAILDWMMPGMDGLEICRRVREVDRLLYVILLTARGSTENLVEGLGAGADDYLVKPFNNDELRARILVGQRVMAMQAALTRRRQHPESDPRTDLRAELWDMPG